MSKLTFSGKLLEKWQIFWYISTFEISKLIEGENQMRFWLLFQWKNQRGGPFTFFRVKINIYQSSPCHAKTAFAPFKWINKMQCIVCLNKNFSCSWYFCISSSLSGRRSEKYWELGGRTAFPMERKLENCPNLESCFLLFTQVQHAMVKMN